MYRLDGDNAATPVDLPFVVFRGVEKTTRATALFFFWCFFFLSIHARETVWAPALMSFFFFVVQLVVQLAIPSRSPNVTDISYPCSLSLFSFLLSLAREH
jgi:hypothetical protein